MDRLIKPWRLAAAIILVLAITAVYLVNLYRLQIVEGAAYYAQSQNSIVTKNTMDERVLRALERKDRVQEALIEAVKAEVSVL